VDKVKCEICGELFKGLAGHLKCKHGISTHDYKLNFPNALTLSEDFYKNIKESKIKKCIICGNNFSPKDSRNITCGKICRYKHTSSIRKGKIRSGKYSTVKCLNCHSESFLKKYTNGNHFCDRKCYDEYHMVQKIETKCEYKPCTNTFNLSEKEISIRKYCSRECYKLDYNEKRENFNQDSKYKKGYYISLIDNSEKWFDSSYELSRMKQLDLDNSILEWSKNKIKIKYIGEDGEEHIYTPDLLIKYKDGTSVIEEVKGRITRRDVLKMEATIPYLEKMNIKYKIVQKNDIYDDYIEPIIEDYENKFGTFQRISLLYSFMKMTNNISDRSTCIRRKVGCLVIPSNLENISSIGYNGSIPGEENGCKDIGSGKCGCIHAEINALNKFKNYDDKIDYILLCTLSPCLDCSREILKYPIKKVIYLNCYRDTYGIKFLKSNNIEVVSYDTVVKESNNRYIKR
jgi:dCMP deaminase